MKRVLFVDDEPKVLEGLQRMLRPRRKEWEMLFAQSAPEALRLLAERLFDVVVTDVRMPDMDGIQLLEQVQERYPEMIRIVLSGYFEREAALRAAGIAHQYLAKPCHPDKLLDTIESLCRSTALLSSEAARGVVSAIGSLPSPPDTYRSLKRALQEPKVCLEHVGAIIEQDVGMTAKVLQLVNSPLFEPATDVTDVSRALSYIGLTTLKELVLSIEIFRNLEPEPCPGFSFEVFQAHSRLAAKIAAQLPAPAEITSIAVVAALLHDSGKLVLAARLPELFEEALRASVETGRPAYQLEQETIGTTHAEIGAYLLSLWGLPQIIVDAVCGHHRPSTSQRAGNTLDVLAVTHIANALACDVSAGIAPDGPPAEGTWDLEYLQTLGRIEQVPVWRRIAMQAACLVEA